jgi:hypothetical protein
MSLHTGVRGELLVHPHHHRLRVEPQADIICNLEEVRAHPMRDGRQLTWFIRMNSSPVLLMRTSMYKVCFGVPERPSERPSYDLERRSRRVGGEAMITDLVIEKNWMKKGGTECFEE